ncbi:ABC transporter permease [Streptomyces sp. NPDC046182]|uniref:ABC transporter permease n=1 Tax=Streptomyces sp. NPDC046182 TaxID=3154601 RepID=UPI0033D01F83
MTGFVLLRVRAHRLLLAAALLAVLLTTSVLATLAAFSGSIGDAALQGTLRGRAAPAAALVVTGHVPPARRESADTATREAAGRTFDGLPVTVRKLERSGPYALPRTLQTPAARLGEPDLTHFAALDRSRLALVKGAWPVGTGIDVAVPEEAARRLRIGPGTVLELADRFGGKPVRARVTGVYRPADLTDPYWQLDHAGGRGVKTVDFTTYGPLLTDPAVLRSGRITSGETAWLATADFTGVTTDRMDALRASASAEPKALTADGAPFGGAVSAHTALPTVLEQTARSLLVSRSTLMIVAVQLVLLAAYALLLVARLLSSERSGETALLRARGGSRRRIAALAAAEALLLALPAALIAPLLAGPLTRLLAGRASLDALGVRLDGVPLGQVWLVAALVAVACAAAVVAPALSTGDDGAVTLRKGRAAALPAPVRAGADVGLLAVAAVAYWQLDRQTGGSGEGSGGGALSGDRGGSLGVDPLLVAAPALALLAGTVLTLRLLPPTARLAERRAASGRGLPAALAGWQFSRRPLRGAGPVLLLVLAVAMGMLAVGQSASWDRSQADRADFRTGTALRVLSGGGADPSLAGQYTALPAVRSVAPAHRATTSFAGNRTATVLALDTRHAADGFLLREDLADARARELLPSLAPKAGPRPGIVLPVDVRGLTFELRRTAPRGTAPAQVTVVVEDPYGVPYRQLLGPLPADGRSHRLTLDLGGPGAARSTPVGPLTLTGVELDGTVVDGQDGKQTFAVERLVSRHDGGSERPVDAVRSLVSWRVGYQETSGGDPGGPVALTGRAVGPTPYELGFTTGMTEPQVPSGQENFGLRITAPRTAPPTTLSGVATDAFLSAAGAKRGDRVEVSLGSLRLNVTIVDTVRELPTTGAGATALSASAPAATPDDGGALLVDLDAANRFLSAEPTAALQPNEWWLTTAPGRADDVARALRARPDTDPAQVLVRDEAAAELLGDPLGAGPNAALMAVAVAAAALAAVGFAVSAAGSTRERSAEFGVLRALGAPRRQLARLIAAEQGLLVGIGLLVGVALGAVLTRAVVPLIVLTGQAAQPVPHVLVQLPPGHVALLLAGVAALPLLIVATIALRRTDPAVTLRHQGDQ